MAGVATGASTAAPVRARMRGDSVVVKKKKGRVLDAKTVTQLNSVRVSFVNRKENGGSLAKAPVVGHVAWAVFARRCVGRAGCCVGTREGRQSGPRCEISFPIFQ